MKKKIKHKAQQISKGTHESIKRNGPAVVKTVARGVTPDPESGEAIANALLHYTNARQLRRIARLAAGAGILLIGWTISRTNKK